ncbi:unnamed protein product [Ixodes pacificus]
MCWADLEMITGLEMTKTSSGCIPQLDVLGTRLDQTREPGHPAQLELGGRTGAQDGLQEGGGQDLAEHERAQGHACHSHAEPGPRPAGRPDEAEPCNVGRDSGTWTSRPRSTLCRDTPLPWQISTHCKHWRFRFEFRCVPTEFREILHATV